MAEADHTHFRTLFESTAFFHNVIHCVRCPLALTFNASARSRGLSGPSFLKPAGSLLSIIRMAKLPAHCCAYSASACAVTEAFANAPRPLVLPFLFVATCTWLADPPIISGRSSAPVPLKSAARRHRGQCATRRCAGSTDGWGRCADYRTTGGTRAARA
jgi:hypothetical protein